MHASTGRPLVTCLAILTVAACADRAPASDSARDSAPPAAGASASGDSGRTPAPGSTSPSAPSPNTPSSGASSPVAGRPACARPVPVTYYARGGVTDEFIVTFGGMNGANADAVIDSLGRSHGFTATHRYEGAFSGFSAKLPLATLEAIRCVPSVTRISQVVVGGIGAAPPPGADR